MRDHLRNPKSANKNDKGKLAEWVYKPEFMTDPGHHKKSVSKYVYDLAPKLVSDLE